MKKQKAGSNPTSTHHELVQVDVEYPRYLKDFENLELEQQREIDRSLDKIEQMTWAQILATSSKAGKRGLNWEPLADQKTASGSVIATIRISKKFRARVTRSGVFMRFISLHPDHDSAYDEDGGEDI